MANEFAIPSTLDEVSLTTSLADYNPTMTDNIYNANILLRTYNRDAKKLIDGGLSIVEPLIKEEQDAGGFYLGEAVLNNTQPHTTTLCEFKWQNAYEPIVITRDEERQNSGQVHKIVSLVGTKIMLSEKAISKRIEQALSTPVGEANNLIDLETLVNTGTLGTVAGATDTFWQATVTASGPFATQGLTDMATATFAVSAASNEDNPTIYVTNKTVFQKFWNTRLPLERISNGDMTANAGARNLTFMGVPIAYGNYIGSGLLFGLNMNYNKLAVDTITDFITTDFIKPSRQTVRSAYIIVRLNQITNNRRRNFKLTGIS